MADACVAVILNEDGKIDVSLVNAETIPSKGRDVSVLG